MFVNVLDPQLPTLASNAAVELDLLINGEPAELNAVSQLGDRLRQTLDKPQADQPARGLHIDTETEAILGQAFTIAGADAKTIVADLIQKTEEIAEQLSTAEAETETTELELQRAFCLALCECASAFRQMAFDVRPPHPYRR